MKGGQNLWKSSVYSRIPYWILRPLSTLSPLLQGHLNTFHIANHFVQWRGNCVCAVSVSGQWLGPHSIKFTLSFSIPSNLPVHLGFFPF